MEENIEKRYFEYMQSLADALIPISQMITMHSTAAMVSKWTNGEVKKNTLLVEPPGWVASDLRGAEQLKIYTTGIAIVSPGDYRNEEEVAAIKQECDMLLDQLTARMLEDSAPGPNKLMRDFGRGIEAIDMPPLNQKSAIGRGLQISFKTHANIYIKEELWR